MAFSRKSFPITGLKALGELNYYEAENFVGHTGELIRVPSVCDRYISTDFEGYVLVIAGKRLGWIPKNLTTEALDELGYTPPRVKITDLRPLEDTNSFCFFVSAIDECVKSSSQPKEQSTVANKIPSLQQVLQDNIKSATAAGKLEVGHVANEQLVRILGKRLPKKYAPLLETPFGALAVANATMYVAQAVQPGNQTLASVSQAMVVDAYQQILKLVDLPGLVNELLTNTEVAKALDQAKAE